MRVYRYRSDNGWWLDLLNPVIVVFCLFACQSAYGRPVSVSLGYLALLAFVVSTPVLSRPDLAKPTTIRPAPFWRLPAVHILLRWGAIVMGLLFLAFVFDIGPPLFSRNVMVTWFVVTPLALIVAHAIRQRANNHLDGSMKGG